MRDAAEDSRPAAYPAMSPLPHNDESPFAFSAPSYPASPVQPDHQPTARTSHTFNREISPAIAALAELYASRPPTAESYSVFRDGAPNSIVSDITPVLFDATPNLPHAQVGSDVHNVASARQAPVDRAAQEAYARYKETGVHFEPGISQVRPGTALGQASNGERKPRLIQLDPLTLRPLDPNTHMNLNSNANAMAMGMGAGQGSNRWAYPRW